MSDTPRTDTFELGYFRKATSHVDDVFDFARHLEHEVMEQARLNGMGSEREAGLLGKVGRLERENAALRKSMKSITPLLDELVKVFDYAQTNGDLFDLADVCIKYRDAIDAARKEQG